MNRPDNLFASVPESSANHEQISEILARPGLKIERIASTGQASPPGFWYDQPWDEWVAVLAGAARLRFENEPDARQLSAGDYVLIPAHTRHRVDWTSPERPTVWLALHFRD
jgi:cupin 2 domain-containing protein